MSFRYVMVLAALLAAGAGSAQTPPPADAAAPAAAAAPPAAAPTAAAPPTEAKMEAPAADAVVLGDAKAGATKAALCGACHGIDGNPADKQYPKLAGQNEAYIARQITLFKTMKRQNAIMMGFAATLSVQDMHDIGAYFASKASLPASPTKRSSSAARPSIAAATPSSACRPAWPATDRMVAAWRDRFPAARRTVDRLRRHQAERLEERHHLGRRRQGQGDADDRADPQRSRHQRRRVVRRRPAHRVRRTRRRRAVIHRVVSGRTPERICLRRDA